MGDAQRYAFDTIDAGKPDTRSTAQRLADVLAESHREDTSADFRLGLLQGALAVAMPDLLRNPFKPTKKPKTKRSRTHA